MFQQGKTLNLCVCFFYDNTMSHLVCNSVISKIYSEMHSAQKWSLFASIHFVVRTHTQTHTQLLCHRPSWQCYEYMWMFTMFTTLNNSLSICSLLWSACNKCAIYSRTQQLQISIEPQGLRAYLKVWRVKHLHEHLQIFTDAWIRRGGSHWG